MTDREWDEKLHIRTEKADYSREDQHHRAYEPTPYCVLERIADSGYLFAHNTLVDYGSGLGRTAIFLNQRVGCPVIGIEREPAFYEKALQNLEESGAQNVDFLLMDAADYEVQTADCFYFFNPFSVTILRPVIRRILDSFYEYERSMKLFFYYPSDEFTSYLMTEEELEFFDDLSCRDLFGTEDPRESILVFGVG